MMEERDDKTYKKIPLFIRIYLRCMIGALYVLAALLRPHKLSPGLAIYHTEEPEKTKLSLVPDEPKH